MQVRNCCSKHGHPRGFAGKRIIGGERVLFDDCPVNLISAGAYSMLRAYGHWSDGRLWYPGALCEQPAQYVRSMEIIGNELAAIRRRERDTPKK